jgi:dTDP-4-dehydrorhamnose reductase
MKKILILGHKGMLGNVLCKYFGAKNDYEVLAATNRWGDSSFEAEMQATDADFIINCIGLIPQRKPTDAEYKFINTDLPIFLDSLGKKIIHPSTDCEFKGAIPPTEKYPKSHPRDVEDAYGRSKADASQFLEDSGKNTKMIRTSIIGHEVDSHLALLDWFLNSEGEVKGYTNHYWNGITTLEWAKIAEDLMHNWDASPVVSQFGTDENKSKYEVLGLFKEIYGKEISIIPFDAAEAINRCVETDKPMPSLTEQLKELKAFYGK